MVTRYPHLFVVALLTIMLPWDIPAGAQVPTLTPTDIGDAIRWGETGEPFPYLLHHAQSQGASNKVVVGVVYTPFVRVALLSKAAYDVGRRLTPEDIPASMTEPTVYIGFRWYCCDGDHGDLWSYHPFEPFDYRVAVPGNPRLGGIAQVAAHPLWVTRDLSRLDVFGGAPYTDVVLLAGYSGASLRHPGDFVIYRNVANPLNDTHPGTQMRIGRLTVADVQAWR